MSCFRAILLSSISLFLVSPCSGCVSTGQSCDISVTKGSIICDQERAFIDAREPMVAEAIKKFVGADEVLRKNPTISFCFSGGGYRAMIASLGFSLGAKEIGLTDVTKYVASLSGSTWNVGHSLLRKSKQNLELEEFREVIQKRVENGFLDPVTFNLSLFVKSIFNVFSERGKIEPADLWGMLYADRMWGDMVDAHHMKFSDIAELFKDKNFNHPFPLFPLILADEFPYEWLEVNPFTVGSDYLNASIPTSLFDSPFINGKCQVAYSEQTLGWFLGMFGSAYNLSFGDVIDYVTRLTEDKWLVEQVEKIIDRYCLYERRALPSPVYNFTYNMDYKSLNSQQEFEVSDAGIAYSLPLPILLNSKRFSDIIIVFDSSSNASAIGYPELKFARAYMDRKGIKFPPLDNPTISSQYVRVFEDENDSSVPTIVYIASPKYVPMSTFTYTKEEFDSLCDAAKDVVIDNKDLFVEVINRKINALYS